MECALCGTCCVAPDISTLKKPVGVPCRFLHDTVGCTIYQERPEVCREYRPDEICRKIAAPTLAERVKKYLRLFGMEDSEQHPDLA